MGREIVFSEKYVKGKGSGSKTEREGGVVNEGEVTPTLTSGEESGHNWRKVKGREGGNLCGCSRP